MRKEFFIFLIFVPVAFLIFGIANLLIITNFTMGYGFLIASLVSAILVFLIYILGKSGERRINKLKSNKQYVMLNIDKIEQEDNILDIIGNVRKDGVKYYFSSSYYVENDKLCNVIENKMKKKKINKIKVWVNLDKFKYFEYEINGFLEELGVIGEVELIGWGSTNNPQGFGK